MTPLRVGVVGCGMIARKYVNGSAAFDTYDVVACADLDRAAAEAFGREHGLDVLALEDLVAAPGLDAVLNLTPPAVHAEIVRAALTAGKHVYTEKPLATSLADGAELVAEARRRGLRLGCAPDTFLGSAYEAGRAAILRGDIGEPLGATARLLVGGPDSWHPNADMFYAAGGGPMLDLAPYYLAAVASLLGPYEAATGFATTITPERTLAVGPRAGKRFPVVVPTHVAALLRLRSGSVLSLTVSFEAGQYDSMLLVHGSEGTLQLPDANAFEGAVRIRTGGGEWAELPYHSRGPRETRGIGLDEMVQSLRAGTPHRASGELGLHVLEVAMGVLRSAEEGRTVEITPLLDSARSPDPREQVSTSAGGS